MQFGETLSNYSPAGTPDQDIDVVSLPLTRDTMDAVIRVSRDFVPARARELGLPARSTGISFLPSSPTGERGGGGGGGDGGGRISVNRLEEINPSLQG